MNASHYFISLLFGHLLGDFVFQNQWMAMNKSASSWKCLVHCVIYTACVELTAWADISPAHRFWFPLFIFVTHFPIDRWSLADQWLLEINGRSLKGFIANGHKQIPNDLAADERLNYQILRGSFAGVVYTAVDNTFHFILMYYGGLWLFS